MSDLSAYRNQVAELGKNAVEAEKNQNWELAYDNYVSALKIFMHMIKCKYFWLECHLFTFLRC